VIATVEVFKNSKGIGGWEGDNNLIEEGSVFEDLSYTSWHKKPDFIMDKKIIKSVNKGYKNGKN
jgi:hypothetical protein